MDKHTKGYIYDSLVYRYIRAREKNIELETKTNIRLHPSMSKDQALKLAEEMARRDILRFIDILDEGIGEHD